MKLLTVKFVEIGIDWLLAMQVAVAEYDGEKDGKGNPLPTERDVSMMVETLNTERRAIRAMTSTLDVGTPDMSGQDQIKIG